MKDYFGKDYTLLKKKKLWLFDMDGTIYLGNKIFDGTLDILKNIKKSGAKYVFITNNSSKGIDEYLQKVGKMNIPADKESFYTSVDASVAILKERFGNQLIYAQGTDSFIKNLKKEGLNITTEYDENAVCVIVAFDLDLTEKKLSNTCRMLLKDVPFYATNPDFVCPTEFGYIPDCGSMCFGIEKATGRKPVYIGKPNSLMIEEVMKKFNCSKKETVVIGDRIYTDIASGVNAGVDTVLVLSGETTIEIYDQSQTKPTYVISNVREMNKIFEK